MTSRLIGKKNLKSRSSKDKTVKLKSKGLRHFKNKARCRGFKFSSRGKRDAPSPSVRDRQTIGHWTNYLLTAQGMILKVSTTLTETELRTDGHTHL